MLFLLWYIFIDTYGFQGLCEEKRRQSTVQLKFSSFKHYFQTCPGYLLYCNTSYHPFWSLGNNKKHQKQTNRRKLHMDLLLRWNPRILKLKTSSSIIVAHWWWVTLMVFTNGEFLLKEDDKWEPELQKDRNMSIFLNFSIILVELRFCYVEFSFKTLKGFCMIYIFSPKVDMFCKTDCITFALPYWFLFAFSKFLLSWVGIRLIILDLIKWYSLEYSTLA